MSDQKETINKPEQEKAKQDYDQSNRGVKGTDNHKEKGFTDDAPIITFSTFVLSLSSSAFIHFGDVPDPASGGREVNLPLAKQTIDILSILHDKSKGNLTHDEETLLSNVLYELRIKYLALLKK